MAGNDGYQVIRAGESVSAVRLSTVIFSSTLKTKRHCDSSQNTFSSSKFHSNMSSNKHIFIYKSTTVVSSFYPLFSIHRKKIMHYYISIRLWWCCLPFFPYNVRNFLIFTKFLSCQWNGKLYKIYNTFKKSYLKFAKDQLKFPKFFYKLRN